MVDGGSGCGWKEADRVTNEVRRMLEQNEEDKGVGRCLEVSEVYCLSIII